MNYIPEVAKMLGVEIGEEFKIEGYQDFIKFRFDELSLEYLSNGEWYLATSVLCDLLNGNLKLIKLPKPVLDEKEREYLSYVIKPFRDSVTYFYKRRYENDELEWIKIEMKNDDVMYFPKFKKGTMYKGMELNKKYTLEELGL